MSVDHEKAREIKTYTVIDGVMARKNIEIELRSRVEAIRGASFCPKGWIYNDAHFLRPVFDYVLGECTGNGTYAFYRKPTRMQGFYYEGLSYSSTQDSWVLRVEIRTQRITPPDFKEGFAKVLIPEDTMQEIVDQVFGDAQEALVRWGW